MSSWYIASCVQSSWRLNTVLLKEWRKRSDVQYMGTSRFLEDSRNPPKSSLFFLCCAKFGVETWRPCAPNLWAAGLPLALCLCSHMFPSSHIWSLSYLLVELISIFSSHLSGLPHTPCDLMCQVSGWPSPTVGQTLPTCWEKLEEAVLFS